MYSKTKNLFIHFSKRLGIMHTKVYKTIITNTDFDTANYRKIADIINCHATWSSTKEGYDFWYGVNILWQLTLYTRGIGDNASMKDMLQMFLQYSDTNNPIRQICNNLIKKLGIELE